MYIKEVWRLGKPFTIDEDKIYGKCVLEFKNKGIAQEHVWVTDREKNLVKFTAKSKSVLCDNLLERLLRYIFG